MNSTGHSVCPHVTPDWIVGLCWLNAKFSLLPLLQTHVHPSYPPSPRQLFFFKLWSEKSYWQRLGLRCSVEQSFPSLPLKIDLDPFIKACVLSTAELNVRCSFFWKARDRKRKKQWRECEMNVISKRKDVCEEEWAVPAIRGVLSSCWYAYSIFMFLSW